HGWGNDGLSPHDVETLSETATHISETERRSMAAERDTTDRYLAAYLSDRVGSEFAGRISGVTRFGCFVKLNETGADGLIPIRSLGREFFHFDADAQTLMGADTGLTISIGQKVTVRLAEAVPVTGGLMLEMLEIEGNAMPGGPSAKRGKFAPRNPGKGRSKATKIKRKVERKRR
ncbi:MAG: S1 RNA-binding domain-containing protein, partial [Albidovulum sp.]